MHEGDALICGGRGPDGCWLSSLPWEAQSFAVGHISLELHKSHITKEALEQGNSPQIWDQRYEASPTVLKTCHYFLGDDDENGAFVFLFGARFLHSFIKGKLLRSMTNGQQVSGTLSQESLPLQGDHI